MPITPSRLRLAVQAGFAAFLAWTCVRFLAHADWAMGRSEAFTPKPPAVEGFLPISALMAAKRMVLSGQWDPVHPAGLAIFLAILATALLWRKGFCGQLCPVGFVSSLLERLGRGLGIVRQPGPRLARVLGAPKYLLLGGFGYAALSMDVEEIEAFLRAPFNLVADTKMLVFFQHPSGVTLVVLGVLGAASVVVPAFWCRVLCPYGALLGLLSRLSPTAVARDPGSCLSCGRCARACPANIPVDRVERVTSPACQGCLECVSVCPAQGCLGLSLGKRRIPWWSIAVGCLAVLVLGSVLADALGFWRSSLPASMVRRMHAIMFGGMPGF